MPPKPPAPTPKKSQSQAPSFPLPNRPTPVAIRPLSPRKARSLLCAGSDFLLSHRTTSEMNTSTSATAVTKHTTTTLFGGQSTGVAMWKDAVASQCGKEQVISCAAGMNHVLVACPSGLCGWGCNDDMQLNAPGVTDSLARIELPRMGATSNDAARLSPPTTVIDCAAGSSHSLALVLRTKEDAYFDQPGASEGFIPYTQVLSCGRAIYAALGHAPPRGAPFSMTMAIDAGPAAAPWSAVSSLDDQCVDAVWAVKDLSFARGSLGLYAWGTIHRRVRILRPSLILAASAGVVTSVTATDDSVVVAVQGGGVFEWRPVLGMGDIGIAGFDVTHSTDWQNPFARVGLQSRAPFRTNGRALKVSAGRRHAVVLYHDGQMIAWGDNGFGQCGHAEGTFVVEDVHFCELFPASVAAKPPPIAEAPASAVPSSPTANSVNVGSAEKGSTSNKTGVKPASQTLTRKPSGMPDPLEQSQASRSHPQSRPESALEGSTAVDQLTARRQQAPVNVTCGPFATFVLVADGTVISFGRDSAFGL